MKILAIICNIIMFGFICLVIVTDGPPRDASYVVFTLWWLLTLILNMVVIFYIGVRDGWSGLHLKRPLKEQKKIDDLSSMSTIMRIVAIICNIFFFGFVCWAFVDQYPHPKEDGIIAFTVMMVLTPILSLVVLFLRGVGDSLPGLNMKSKSL